MPKPIKYKKYLWIIAAFLAVLIAFYFFWALPAYKSAEEFGKEGGSTLGNLTGNFAGSFEGLTKGQIEGSKDGEAYAINNPNVDVNIVTRVKEMGVLEVLDISMKRSCINSTDGNKHYELWISSCKAIYSVDLTKADYIEENNELIVTIPYPTVETVFEEPRKIAEYETKRNAGSTQNGSLEYITSENKIREEIKLELANDSEISKKAEEAAVRQVENIIKNIDVGERTITVGFKEKNNAEG